MGWVSGALLVALLFTLFTACTKNNAADSAPGQNQNKLNVYLTDGPGFFDDVMVDVRSVAVKIDTTSTWWPKHKKGDDDDQGEDNHDGLHMWGNHDRQDKDAFWDTLAVPPGIYDLLKFANGADTMLANVNIPKGRILAFRITLGDHNSVVKDSVTYPVHLMPGWDDIYVRVSGINFEDLASNHFRIWLDFDAGRSVVRVRQGEFFLRPVIKAFAVSNTGSVKGTIHPGDAFPVVSVYNSSDTSYAIPGHGSMFMVRGLAEGTYSVFVNASNGYQDTTIANVSVKAGQTLDLGSIRLHK